MSLTFLGHRVSLCSAGWPWTRNPPAQPPKCWDYRLVPPRLAPPYLLYYGIPVLSSIWNVHQGYSNPMVKYSGIIKCADYCALLWTYSIKLYGMGLKICILTSVSYMILRQEWLWDPLNLVKVLHCVTLSPYQFHPFLKDYQTFFLFVFVSSTHLSFHLLLLYCDLHSVLAKRLRNDYIVI
jgi:hypothetical protein